MLLILAEENVDITTKDDLDVSEMYELNADPSSEEEHDDRPDNGDLDKEPVDSEGKNDDIPYNGDLAKPVGSEVKEDIVLT